MPNVNPQRLLDDLHRLRSFGASGTGVVRTALSETDLESRRWLRQRFADAGLDATIDSVGNVIGLSRNEGPAVLIGSHSDTQPEGGWLDGAYGVICALEVARAFREDEQSNRFAVDAASWMDEEGTFFGSFGSMHYCESLSESDFENATSADGRKLKEELIRSGLSGNPAMVIQPDRQIAYLEAHIEQGPVLDSLNQRIGVVTDIVGVREGTFMFRGEQNHAGTTPMSLRRDAVATLMAVGSEINRRFPEIASDVSVWTIGYIKLATQSSSIVPGRAEMRLQFRDPDNSLLEEFEKLACAIAAAHNDMGGVKVSFHVDERLLPAKMDESLQESIAISAETHAPGLWRRMPSGAAHDAQVLAERVPSAMVFVPSIGGVSHSFTEDTAEDDLVLGCQVLADAAFNILKEKVS